MRKCNLIKVALGTIMCSVLLAGTCFAAEREGELRGLSVSVDTDKDEYEAGEHIIVKVTVKNPTEENVEDIIIKNVVPSGYQLAAGSEKDFTIDSIEANTEVIKTTEYEIVTTSVAVADEGHHDKKHHHESKSTPTTTVVEETVVPLSDTIETVAIPDEAVAQAAAPQTGAPKTGDDSNMLLWMVLLVASAVACGVLYMKKKEVRKYLAFALVVAVAGGSISVSQMSAHAAASDNSITLAKTVSVAGNEVTLESNIFCGAMVSGCVYDATNPDNKISGATIKFRSGKNNKTGDYVKSGEQVIELTSGSDGSYMYSLPKGDYTIECTKEGYITSYENITCDVLAHSYDIPMSTELSGDQYRVVLRWGSTPSDIDSHLELPDGGHVYFSNKICTKNGQIVAQLDVDDTDGYGPETTTFTISENGTYHFYVLNYTNRNVTNSPVLAASGATVKVFKGNNEIAEYNISSCQGAVGTYWNVFEIKNGQLISINAVGTSKDVTENNYGVAAASLDDLDALALDADAVVDADTDAIVADQTTADDQTDDDQTNVDNQADVNDQVVTDDQLVADDQTVTDDQGADNDAASTDADDTDNDLSDDADDDVDDNIDAGDSQSDDSSAE